MTHTSTFEEEVRHHTIKQNAAVRLVEIVSDLWFNQEVELVLLRNQLIDRRVSSILQLHQHTSALADHSLTIFETVRIAEIIRELHLPPSRIDIGTLAIEARESVMDEQSLSFFVKRRIAPVVRHATSEAKDVVLYGFGRIGRLLARELANKAGSGKGLCLRAIVTRDRVDKKTLEKRAGLLRKDSIHGDFEGTIEVDVEKQALIINGATVYVLSTQTPEGLDYTRYGIRGALIIDNTGAYRNEQELARHLQSKGVGQVLLTAPGKDIPNVVFGVNEGQVAPAATQLCSAASCTTNAICPVLAVIEREYGIVKGHIETVHAYTNDQNLVDNMHKKNRRGRAAALNMVITETGAGEAVAKILPSLAGRLTSNAIRVPVPNGSLAILQLAIQKPTEMSNLLSTLKSAALTGHLVEQIKYENNVELVSSDIVGTTAASVVDISATIVSSDGKNIILYVWYDNEYGYTHQVLRLANYLSGIKRFTYY